MNVKHRIRTSAILRRDDALLLVAQRSPYTGRVRWMIPGGGLEVTDASMFEGVVREVWEETGLRVHAGPLLFVSEFFMQRDAILVLELGIACHPLSGTDFGTPTLANALEDDYLVDIAWMTREDLLADTERLNPRLVRDTFWAALDGTNGAIPVLART
jgi:8-oxo-dGTP diphosphatase